MPMVWQKFINSGKSNFLNQLKTVESSWDLKHNKINVSVCGSAFAARCLFCEIWQYVSVCMWNKTHASLQMRAHDEAFHNQPTSRQRKARIRPCLCVGAHTTHAEMWVENFWILCVCVCTAKWVDTIETQNFFWRSVRVRRSLWHGQTKYISFYREKKRHSSEEDDTKTMRKRYHLANWWQFSEIDTTFPAKEGEDVTYDYVNWVKLFNRSQSLTRLTLYETDIEDKN